MAIMLLSADVRNVSKSIEGTSSAIESTFEKLDPVKSYLKILRTEWFVETTQTSTWLFRQIHKCLKSHLEVKNKDIDLLVMDITINTFNFSGKNLGVIEFVKHIGFEVETVKN